MRDAWPVVLLGVLFLGLLSLRVVILLVLRSGERAGARRMRRGPPPRVIRVDRDDRV